MNDEIIHFIRDICRLERDYYVAFGEGYEYQPQYQAAMRALEARCAELELRFR